MSIHGLFTRTLVLAPCLVGCASAAAPLAPPKPPIVAAHAPAPVSTPRAPTAAEVDVVTAEDVEVPEPLHVVKLAAGGNGTAALLSDGTIRAWGGVRYRGEYSIGDPDLTRAVVRTVPTYARAIDLYVRYDLVCALLEDHTVECGSDSIDKSPHAKTDDVESVEPGGCYLRPGGRTDCGRGTLGAVQAVATASGGGPFGSDYNCAIRTNGTIGCWGMWIGREWEYWGDEAHSPYHRGIDTVEKLRDATLLRVSDTHACALANGGTLYCWGWGGKGQLGNGKFGAPYAELLPQTVKNIDDVEEVTVGSSFTCARKHDGKVLCWGDNDDGLLALGDTKQRNLPTEVPALEGAKQIVAGLRHACAILKSGDVACWGWNGFGQLATGKVDTVSVQATPMVLPIVR